MVKFTMATRVFYQKHGVELPKEMTHAEFKQFLKATK